MSLAISEDCYLVIDLEATCCDDRSIPRAEMEIIEIGAMMVRRGDGATVGEWQTFVRPVVHPTLTAFCTSLTTITQAEVDGAPGFPEALDALVAWAAPFGTSHFCSWGDYDRHQLHADCARHGVPYPFGEAHTNLKRAYGRIVHGASRGPGMARALRQLGLPLVGTHHRALDDVRNIVRILGVLREREAASGVS